MKSGLLYVCQEVSGPLPSPVLALSRIEPCAIAGFKAAALLAIDTNHTTNTPYAATPPSDRNHTIDLSLISTRALVATTQITPISTSRPNHGPTHAARWSPGRRAFRTVQACSAGSVEDMSRILVGDVILTIRRRICGWKEFPGPPLCQGTMKDNCQYQDRHADSGEQDQFDDYRESTIGAAFLTQTLALDEQTTVKFEIWDTAGQERYKSLAPMYYRNANCAVVVYDITQAVRDAHTTS